MRHRGYTRHSLQDDGQGGRPVMFPPSFGVPRSGVPLSPNVFPCHEGVKLFPGLVSGNSPPLWWKPAPEGQGPE